MTEQAGPHPPHVGEREPPAISVVMPTRDRSAVLLETLRALDGEASTLPGVEVVVVDDGSTDATVPSVEAFASTSTASITVLSQPPRGPAAARNRGITAAHAETILFLGDDIRPRPRLLARHAVFHREHPSSRDAMLGRVVPDPALADSEFIRWLHTHGAQFGYAKLDPRRPAPPECFWTANVSAKAGLLREVGGFDEAFDGAACEDAELGLRLARAGLRLHYEPDAAAEHFHPTDLPQTLARMRRIGIAYRTLVERAPDFPEPRRPGARHRLKAATLTALHLSRVRTPAVRHASWRFLCDEALREAYWGSGDSDPIPRIGGRLARLAWNPQRPATEGRHGYLGA
jgi:glycosyltransferase involved in cell wall biosynthesis